MGPSITSPYLQELPGDPELVCPGGDGWVGGWIRRGRGWGNSRGSDRKGENAPRELCPSSLPPNSGPLHIFLAGAQPFPFNTGGTAPPREGVQGPWECLATVEDLGGGRGPRKGAAVSFGSEEGAYELGLPRTRPRPRYPTFQIRSCHCCPLSVTPGRGWVQDVRHCAGR